MQVKIEFKRLLLLIFNIILLFVTFESVLIFLKEPMENVIFRFVLFGIPWIATNCIIIDFFVSAARRALWIFTTALTIIVYELIPVLIMEPKFGTLFWFIFFGTLWIFAGFVIISSFINVAKKKS